MSIIHEALKKVQSERSENTRTQNNIAPAPKRALADSNISSAELTAYTEITKNSWALNKRLWSLLLFILVAFIFYNLYKYNLRITKITIANSTMPSVQSLADKNTNSLYPSATTAPVVRTPTPPQPKKGELILSGIVEMDGKNFALINNEFYEKGETVEGAKITRITTDSINILQKNKQRTIKILRPREP